MGDAEQQLLLKQAAEAKDAETKRKEAPQWGPPSRGGRIALLGRAIPSAAGARWGHWGHSPPFAALGGASWRPVAATLSGCRSPSAAGGAGWGQCGSFLAPVGHGMGFCSFRSAVRLGVLAVWPCHTGSTPCPFSFSLLPLFLCRPGPPACLATGGSWTTGSVLSPPPTKNKNC